jgi:two-component system sensor histidine kinase UhpB
MDLRLQINLIMGVLLATFASLLIYLQLDNTRQSVREEMEGASIVATQLLSRLQANSRNSSLQDMGQFLSTVGRVRANEMELRNAQDAVIYHSPPPIYKAGRDAPEWYAHIVSPALRTHEIAVADGRLLLRADPSRAILDGWDDFKPMLLTVLVGFALGNALVFVLVGRAMRPLQQVVHGLQAMEGGSYDTRLPTMQGKEARVMGEAFNAMAQSVQEGIAAQTREREATLALAQNRELTQVIQTRIEEVRGQIARELHDELGQQVTAIKTLGQAMVLRAKGVDAHTENAARMVIDSADAIYEEVHQLVSKLRPLALDRFGLQDALQDLVEDARNRHSAIRIELELDTALQAIEPSLATATYRIVQESLTNALRHAKASEIHIHVFKLDTQLHIDINDNGVGASPDWQDSGQYGVIGMRERAQGLGGSFSFTSLHPSGVRVCAVLPLSHNPSHG